MRALCLEKEWSSLTHADGQEKWGKETGAIWKVLKETGLVAGGPSRGGGHTVPPEITVVFGRVKTTHEVPGTRAQPISGRSWPLMVPLVTVCEQVMESEEPGPRPWTGRWMWVGRRWRQSSGENQEDAINGVQTFTTAPYSELSSEGTGRNTHLLIFPWKVFLYVLYRLLPGGSTN